MLIVEVTPEAFFDRITRRWLCGICGGSGTVRFDHYLREEVQQTSTARRPCFTCGGTGKPISIPPPPIPTRPDMAA